MPLVKKIEWACDAPTCSKTEEVAVEYNRYYDDDTPPLGWCKIDATPNYGDDFNFTDDNGNDNEEQYIKYICPQCWARLRGDIGFPAIPRSFRAAV